MVKVERIQYQAALAGTGAWQGSSCEALRGAGMGVDISTTRYI